MLDCLVGLAVGAPVGVYKGAEWGLKKKFEEAYDFFVETNLLLTHRIMRGATDLARRTEGDTTQAQQQNAGAAGAGGGR